MNFNSIVNGLISVGKAIWSCGKTLIAGALSLTPPQAIAVGFVAGTAIAVAVLAVNFLINKKASSEKSETVADEILKQSARDKKKKKKVSKFMEKVAKNLDGDDDDITDEEIKKMQFRSNGNFHKFCSKYPHVRQKFKFSHIGRTIDDDEYDTLLNAMRSVDI